MISESQTESMSPDAFVCVECSINSAFHVPVPVRAPALIRLSTTESTSSMKEIIRDGYYGWSIARPSPDVLVVTRRRRFPGIRLVKIEFTFNFLARNILRNQKRLAGFDEIEQLHVMSYSISDSDRHRLTAILKEGANVIELDYSYDMWPTVALGKIIGGILDVRVLWKVK